KTPHVGLIFNQAMNGVFPQILQDTASDLLIRCPSNPTTGYNNTSENENEIVSVIGFQSNEPAVTEPSEPDCEPQDAIETANNNETEEKEESEESGVDDNNNGATSVNIDESMVVVDDTQQQEQEPQEQI